LTVDELDLDKSKNWF